MNKPKREFLGVILILSLAAGAGTACRPKVSDEALTARARAIHDRVLTVDTHCDTAMRLLGGDWDIGVRHEPGKSGSKIDLPRMEEGGLDAQFFAVFVGQGERNEPGYARAKALALNTLEALAAMCQKYSSRVGLALTPEDAYRLEKEGRRAAFIGMENGYPVGLSLDNLKEYYDRGVRYLTLCHSRDNDICDSSTDRQNPEDNGLSEFGREVVAACNRLGMMVDVSHGSDKSFFDVLEVSRAPVIASHSSCRALCASPRNLSDEMIRALAAKGGVIQICFLSSYVRAIPPNPEREKALQELRAKYGPRREVQDETLRQKMREEYEALNQKYPEPKATLKELVDHIEHVIRVAGIDFVGIGTDFDGGGGVLGCDDVSEMFHVTEELVRRGHGEKEIAKIWGGNVMRVFTKVIEVGRASAGEQAAQASPVALQTLIQAEKDFAAKAAAKGIRGAFLSFLAPDAIVFRPKPVPGRPVYEQMRADSPTLLTWQPAYAEIAAAGDLGFTTGPYEVRERDSSKPPSGFGHYVSLWKKQPEDVWRVVLDAGIRHPLAAPWPDRTASRAEECRPPAGREAEPDKGKNALIQAEREFAERASREGLSQAYFHFAAEDIRFYRHGSFPAGQDTLPRLAQRADAQYEAEPAAVEVSASGDLGYAYGVAAWKMSGQAGAPVRSESYLRIWRRCGEGRWRIALDLSLENKDET